MKTRILILMSLLIWISCSDDEMLPEEVTITAENFSTTINDSPEAGDLIGTIDAQTNIGSLTFSLATESVDGALVLDETTGELTVGDATVFDYTINEEITGTATVESGDVSETVNISISVAGVVSENFTKTIDEHPDNEELLGTITASTNAGDLVFAISEESPAGALAVDESTGEITVLDRNLFDYESTEEVTATVEVTAGDVSAEVEITITLEDVESSWQTVGEASFSAGVAHDHSIAIYDGVPYVAYRDEENDNKTTVMKYEDDEWQVVGTAGFSEGYATYQSITFNNGIPYVAYRDDVNGRKTTVMKYEGGSWQVVGSKGFAERSYAVSYTSEYQSLVFNDDVPYVAYKDWSRSAKLTVMKYDGEEWVLVGTAGFSSGAASYISLQFYDDVPYVAYQDAGNGSKLTVAKFETSDWSVVGAAGVSSGIVSHVHMVFDGSVPHVAFSDGDESDKTTVMKYTSGDGWTVVGNAGLTASSAQYQSIGMMGDDIIVGFRDSFNSGKATVMKYSGNWDIVGSAGFSAGNVNHLDMKVYDGIPYVVYRDDSGTSATTVMRYDDK